MKNKTPKIKKRTPAKGCVKFKIGDKVSWTSQASGYTKKKIGKVISRVPAESRPALNLAERHRRKTEGWGMYRDHESYVVLVGPKLYWPLVKNLKKLNR